MNESVSQPVKLSRSAAPRLQQSKLATVFRTFLLDRVGAAVNFCTADLKVNVRESSGGEAAGSCHNGRPRCGWLGRHGGWDQGGGVGTRDRVMALIFSCHDEDRGNLELVGFLAVACNVKAMYPQKPQIMRALAKFE